MPISYVLFLNPKRDNFNYLAIDKLELEHLSDSWLYGQNTFKKIHHIYTMDTPYHMFLDKS